MEPKSKTRKSLKRCCHNFMQHAVPFSKSLTYFKLFILPLQKPYLTSLSLLTTWSELPQFSQLWLINIMSQLSIALSYSVKLNPLKKQTTYLQKISICSNYLQLTRVVLQIQNWITLHINPPTWLVYIYISQNKYNYLSVASFTKLYYTTNSLNQYNKILQNLTLRS